MKNANQNNVNTSHNTSSRVTVQIANKTEKLRGFKRGSNNQRYKNNNYNNIKNKNRKIHFI